MIAKLTSVEIQTVSEPFHAKDPRYNPLHDGSSPGSQECPEPLLWGISHLIILLGLMVVLYSSVLFRLGAQWWNDPNFSHGVFVPLFSAFLIWRKREQLTRIPVVPSWGVYQFLLPDLVC